MHIDKEILVNIISGRALDDDIAESILKMTDVGKSAMEDFRQYRLISKKISCHIPTKKNNYKPFPHVM